MTIKEILVVLKLKHRRKVYNNSQLKLFIVIEIIQNQFDKFHRF